MSCCLFAALHLLHQSMLGFLSPCTAKPSRLEFSSHWGVDVNKISVARSEVRGLEESRGDKLSWSDTNFYNFFNCNFSLHMSKTALNTSNFTWHQTLLKQKLNLSMKASTWVHKSKSQKCLPDCFDLNDTWQLCPPPTYLSIKK